jgi:transcriptional regulator with XRE-family HTH domain
MAASEEARHRELAAFLRSRRERIAPESVGLPGGRRRRTPGLRREEVAQLAGVGVTWYTWLEQGRDIRVSAQVLGAIAAALRLERSERGHLFNLAGVFDPSAPSAEAPLPRPVLAMVQALRPLPAYVVNGRWDLLAYNPEAAELGNFEVAPLERRNIMWLAFVHHTLRERVSDHDDEAARHVAMFRAAMADHMDDPAWLRLRDDLMAASAQFRELWDRYDIIPPRTRLKVFRHPEIGVIRLEVSSLFLSDRPHARLVAYATVDEEAEIAVRRLARPDCAVWTADRDARALVGAQ